jgi:hypothetical protein
MKKSKVTIRQRPLTLLKSAELGRRDIREKEMFQKLKKELEKMKQNVGFGVRLEPSVVRHKGFVAPF